MTRMTTREKLRRQIDNLPDDVVEQIADFTLFVMARRQITPIYEDWNDSQWQDFTLEHFFREDDEIEYSLDDAREVYRQ